MLVLIECLYLVNYCTCMAWGLSSIRVHAALLNRPRSGIQRNDTRPYFSCEGLARETKNMLASYKQSSVLHNNIYHV